MTRKRGPIGAGIDGHTSRCRCSTECVEQTRIRVNRQRAARNASRDLVIRHGRNVTPSRQPKHGTRSCYLGGCRRPECAAANNAYMAHYRLTNDRTPKRMYVVAEPASTSPHREFVRADWMNDGACSNHPNPELWFPGRGNEWHEAKAICNACPVQVTCLNYALDQGEKFGIWGGKSERERRRMRAARRVAA